MLLNTVLLLYGGENHRFGNTTVAGKEIKGGGELIKGTNIRYDILYIIILG